MTYFQLAQFFGQEQHFVAQIEVEVVVEARLE